MSLPIPCKLAACRGEQIRYCIVEIPSSFVKKHDEKRKSYARSRCSLACTQPLLPASTFLKRCCAKAGSAGEYEDIHEREVIENLFFSIAERYFLRG